MKWICSELQAAQVVPKAMNLEAMGSNMAPILGINKARRTPDCKHDDIGSPTQKQGSKANLLFTSKGNPPFLREKLQLVRASCL